MVRADLGDGAHRLQLPGHRLDLGQWVQVGLYRYGNLFVLQLEQGGGDREVQARLGRKTQLLLDPDGVTVGGGPEWDQEQDLEEDWEKEQDKNQDLKRNQKQYQKQGHDQIKGWNQEQGQGRDQDWGFQGELGFSVSDLLLCFHLWHVCAAPCRLPAGCACERPATAPGWGEPGAGCCSGAAGGDSGLRQRGMPGPTMPKSAALCRPMEEAPVQVSSSATC